MKKAYFSKVGIPTFFSFLFLFSFNTFAQVGIGTTNPNANALLEIGDATSTTQGLIISRVNLTAINSPAPMTANVLGMIVYNKASNGSGNNAVNPGFYYNDGAQWIRIADATVAGNNWSLTGNADTSPGVGAGQNYLGTTDVKDLIIATQATQRMRIQANGQIAVNNPGLINSENRFLVTAPTGENAIFGTATGSNIAVSGRNFNNGIGVQGDNDGNGIGVSGRNFGTGYGVNGFNDNNAGSGVFGRNTANGNGVEGFNDLLGNGVYGRNVSTGIGVKGENTTNNINSTGVLGVANSGSGVFGVATTGRGVVGQSTATGRGVEGSNSGTGRGVIGFSTSTGIGVKGQNDGAGRGVEGVNLSTGIGVIGFSTSTGVGVQGQNDGDGRGVVGSNTSTGFGVIGFSNLTGVGVQGQNDGAGRGVAGYNTSTGFGVIGFGTSTGVGVQGQHDGAGNAVVGINSSTGTGVSGSSADGIGVFGTSTTFDGVRGEVTNDRNGVIGINRGANGNGVYGMADQANSYGVRARNTNIAGVGLLAYSGSTANFLSGSGSSSTGLKYGVYGKATDAIADPADGTIGSAGGYFSNGHNGYAAVAAWVDPVGNGDDNQNFKIIGTGVVSTIVKDVNENPVIMYAPEAPESFFQDYGIGKLTNGTAIIRLDPNLSKNIRVDSTHPMKVFVQLEGDCNGVYVTNKSANEFTVRELQKGKSNVSFSWSIVATRADEVFYSDKGVARTSYNGQRFPLAPKPLEVQSVQVDQNNSEEVLTTRINKAQSASAVNAETSLKPDVKSEVKANVNLEENVTID